MPQARTFEGIGGGARRRTASWACATRPPGRPSEKRLRAKSPLVAPLPTPRAVPLAPAPGRQLEHAIGQLRRPAATVCPFAPALQRGAHSMAVQEHGPSEALLALRPLLVAPSQGWAAGRISTFGWAPDATRPCRAPREASGCTPTWHCSSSSSLRSYARCPPPNTGRCPRRTRTHTRAA